MAQLQQSLRPAMDSSGGGAVASTGRFYKSRKSRPCDSCRRGKVACDMPLGPPCHRCFSRSMLCTFDHGPGHRKRRRPTEPPLSQDTVQRMDQLTDNVYLDASTMFSGASSIPDPGSLFFHDLVLPGHEPSMGQFNQGNDSTHRRQSQQHLSSPESSSDASRDSNTHPSREGQSSSSLHPMVNLGSDETSLELVPGAFSFYIGPTGAADIHLLNREEFDAQGITCPKIAGLKYRRVSQCTNGNDNHSSGALFGITDQDLLNKAEPRCEEQDIEGAWKDFWKVLDPTAAWRLIKLYGRFVDPYFPILSRQQLPEDIAGLNEMPLALLAAICAAALPFVIHDEGLYSLLLHPPSVPQLHRICWLDISQRLHHPNLATLQACLLLQQKLPTNAYLSDTAFTWSLMSTAVAVAQTIGLHRDPMRWNSVPLWERRLRKRLWWALWTMERWMSLVRGMPSHMNDDDFDVTDLAAEDIADCLSSSASAETNMLQLVKLTQTLGDVQTAYYTVRSISRTSHDLQLSLDLARAPRQQLKGWLDGLDPSREFQPRPRGADGRQVECGLPGSSKQNQGELDGTACIFLCYIVTHMTLFRALLRPLEAWYRQREALMGEAERLTEGARAVVQGSLACVRDFVEFLESLQDVQWNAFWHSWSRPNFAIAGSFMVHLLHIVSVPSARPGLNFDEEHAELSALVSRWRVAIRVSANGAAGARGLANLGLLRVETMLGRLVSSDGI